MNRAEEFRSCFQHESALVMNSKRQAQKESLRIAAVVMLLMVPVWLLVTWSQAKNSYEKQRIQINQIVRIRVDSLDHAITRLKAELKQLQAFIHNHDIDSPEAFAASFDAVAIGMQADSAWVQAYQVIDNGIITHNFPYLGNEVATGLNLLNHPSPEVSNDLRWVMQNRELRLTGPRILVQGEIGLIFRSPAATERNPNRTAAIVVRLDLLLSEVGIPGDRDSLMFAIRRGNESPFSGHSKVFDLSPEIVEYQIINQVWQLAAAPKNGWNQGWLHSVLFFGGNGAAMLALAGVLTYGIAFRQQQLTMSLRQRTEELTAVQDQLGRDVELLSAAEAQWRFSETRFRTIFEQAAIGVATIDSQSLKFQQANRCTEGIFGYSLSALQDLTLQQMIHPEDLESCSESLRRLLNGDIQEYTIEHRCVRSDKSQIWVNQTASRISTQPDTKPSLIVLFEDIHHRKTVEQRLQVLADSLPGLLLYVDRSLVIQFVNKMGEKWHARGVSHAADDMLGRQLVEVISPEHYELVHPWVERALNGETVEFATPQRLVNGEPMFRSVIYAPHHAEDGTVPGFFALVMDITDRRRAELKRDELERQLTEAQKLEAVGTLAGGIAHDFNNMLQVILGYSDILLMHRSDEIVIVEQLTAIRNAAQRSSDLTQQLLAFARKQATAPSTLNLNEAVPRMLRLMRRVVSEEIELTWHASDELWPILIDHAQWDQIVANLILNSRDAIQSHGRIELSAQNLPALIQANSEFVRSSPGDGVVFTISDNGRGMDDVTQARMFEPFFTTKDLGKGTGLGLSTVYGIVDKHDGAISVTSSEGHGTTIKICFPKCEPFEQHKSRGIDVQSNAVGATTILLVEDEPLVLNLGKSLLKTLGYTVIVARSAAEAIGIAEQAPIGLLITDVIMPDLNGQDLATAIVRLQPRVRVLYMSGFANEVLIQRGIDTSNLCFLQKPFSPGELANCVRDLLPG